MHYPQFEDRPGIIVVAGMHGAQIYVAHAGEISRMKTVHTAEPRYSDREGFFVRSTARTYASGSVCESQHEETASRALQAIVSAVQEVAQDFPATDVYLFVPQPSLHSLVERMAQDPSLRIRGTWPGSYQRAHVSMQWLLSQLAQAAARAQHSLR